MTARYELRPVGVFDRQAQALALPGSAAWADYLSYRRAGGEVDAMPPEATAEPIETRRARVLARLAIPERRAESRPYVIAAGAFRLEWREAQILVDACAISAAGGAIPSPFVLEDIAGADVTLGPIQIRNLAEKILERRLRLYKKRRELVRAIEAAANPEAVNPEPGWDPEEPPPVEP